MPRTRRTNREQAFPQETATATSAPQNPATAEAEGRVEVSPTPRARPRAPDPFIEYDKGLRAQATVLYRAMKKGPVPILSIPEAVPEVVQWLRKQGVRVKANLTAGPTTYSLDEAPEEVQALAL